MYTMTVKETNNVQYIPIYTNVCKRLTLFCEK